MSYRLLKHQNRTRSRAILPPESAFTKHYRNHYQAGPEEPLEVHGCELPPVEADDVLTRKDFDQGMCYLNENRAPGHDNGCPEYLRRGGPSLLNWVFVLKTRIWTFVSDIPVID